MRTKKFLITLVLFCIYSACSFAQAADGDYEWRQLSDFVGFRTNTYNVKFIEDVVQDFKFSKVALKKVNTASELGNYFIYLSESPNGVENGYYRIGTVKLYIENGSKKDKIKLKDIPEGKDGWHVYDFGKDLYLLRSDLFNQLENVMVYVPKGLKGYIKPLSKLTEQEVNELKTKANNRGDDNAMLQLAKYYSTTKNGKQEGQQWLEKAAEKGNKEALDELKKIWNDPKYIQSVMKMTVTPVSLPQPTTEFTTPKKAGYTLINTKTIAGFKCDYYAEGVRTFHFGNGDFATFSDGSKNDRQDMKPSCFETSMGDWQLHATDGGIVKQENGIITTTNPNGTVSRTSNTRNLSWDTDREKPSLYRDWFVYDIITLPGSSTPLPRVEFKSQDRYLEQLETSGNLAGNRIYTSKDGNIYSYRQIVNGLPIPASESDSITGIEICRCKNFNNLDAIKLTINYANGDSIISTGAGGPFLVESGSIHRNGGVLTIKVVNGKLIQILTYPNGDKYIGGFNELTCGDCLLLTDLETKKVKYLNGTLIKSNGKRIEYKDGKSEIEIAAAKKADDAEAMALYKQLCTKFGKKYVDAALNYKLMVGMPEELLLRSFTAKLVETGRNYKLYHITGLGMTNFGHTLSDSVLLYSVWVSNGRITSIKSWK